MGRDVFEEHFDIIHDLDHVRFLFPFDSKNKGLLLIYEGQGHGLFQGRGDPGDITHINSGAVRTLKRNVPQGFRSPRLSNHTDRGLVVPHFHGTSREIPGAF